MESSRIARLLEPFAGTELASDLLQKFDAYLELLMRWNARVNLTAIRDPEQIVSRHFGESLFAARRLFDPATPAITIADVGSGAGFPGVPMKLWSPHIRLTLLESQNKKATFLRELVRTLALSEAEVFCGRAEQWGKTADVVTLRAVEKFESVLPIAAGLVAPGGKLCLLIGAKQYDAAQRLVGESWTWRDPAAIPQSDDRIVAIAARAS